MGLGLTKALTTVDGLRKSIALASLALFAGVWIAIVVKLIQFHATTAHPTLVLSGALVTVAGTMSGAVGAGTASVLGILVKQNAPAGASPGDAVTLNQVLTAAGPTSSRSVFFAVLTYLGVGLVLLVAWMLKSDPSPEVVQSYGVGMLGWLTGGLASFFGS